MFVAIIYFAVISAIYITLYKMNNTISKSVWVNVCIIVWDSVGNIVWDSVKYSAQTFTLADTSVVWWRIRSCRRCCTRLFQTK